MSRPHRQSSSLSPSGGPTPTSLDPRDVEQVWYASLKRPWSSLVVLPATPDARARPLAQALAAVGSVHRGADIRVIDAQGAELGRSVSLVLEMSSHVLNGGTVIAVVDPLEVSQAGVPLALAADAVLLCATLGRTELAGVRQAIELIGRQRFIGSVALAREGA